jgi:hypothetical protein
MGNLFLKYKLMDNLAIESFTTIESASGRTPAEAKERTASQFATDLIFRFGSAENFFLGARYNTVTADVAAVTSGTVNSTTVAAPVAAYSVGISRLAIAGGWYVTKNIMAKLEYSNQKYTGVPNVNTILNGYEFHGLSAEAVISF